MNLGKWSQENPRLALTAGFLLWKGLIAAIAIASPGIGYDTSTNQLSGSIPRPGSFHDVPSLANDKLFNFVRWDAIYYTQMAQRGLVLEQEWAFGIGLSSVISYCKTVMFGTSIIANLGDYVLTGIILSHISHWAVTMLVLSIAKTVSTGDEKVRDKIGFMAAALHLLSPAGIFLSAPYAESLFAGLHMLGFYFFLSAVCSTNTSKLFGLLMRVLAGISLGLATAIRSNGILSGTMFLIDAIQLALRIISPRESSFLKPQLVLTLQFTIIGGLCIAVGMFVPQYLAYQEYCGAKQSPRPWCSFRIPSIYTWVQSHYWNVGFLRYWTFGNLPLFLLAAPSLYLLIRSGFEGCISSWSGKTRLSISPSLAAYVALPQLLLAVLALFTYHVQIISRISSGYPFWYIWLASTLHRTSSAVFVRLFIIYALLQAGLYASFLPPA